MTREEALKQIRNWSLPKETREVLETLIPELRENEDERIRKQLIKLVKSHLVNHERCMAEAWLEKHKERVADNGKTSADENERVRKWIIEKVQEYADCGIPFHDIQMANKALDYLEKQKEQNVEYAYQQLIKTAEEEADALYPNPYEKGTKEWSNREIEREYFMKGRINSAIKANPEIYHNWPEVKDTPTQKQKEQKPAEKPSILKILREHLANTPKEQLDVEFEALKDLTIDKPAEWSEGDRHAIENCEYAIKETFKGEQNPHRIETLEWLKVLSLNRKMINEGVEKLCSNEWSEEDERMLKSIVGDLFCGTGFNIELKSMASKKVNWLKEKLKSLRPQKLDASKLENFDPVEVLNRIKTEWPMAWEKVVGKQEWSEEKVAELAIDCAERSPNFPIGFICEDKRRWVKAYVEGFETAIKKSLRPQPKRERQIKEGDKVSIHCRKDREKDIITIYDGEVGEVIHVWDAKSNPWGHIIVKLDDGRNDGFYEDELEILDEPSWKPSEEQMSALDEYIYAKYPDTEKYDKAILSLRDDLMKLM